MVKRLKDADIVDAVISYYESDSGSLPKVICPYGHPDMLYDVLDSLGWSYDDKDYTGRGWGDRHRRASARIAKALNSDSRFRKCYVSAYRRLVAFEYLG